MTTKASSPTEVSNSTSMNGLGTPNPLSYPSKNQPLPQPVSIFDMDDSSSSINNQTLTNGVEPFGKFSFSILLYVFDFDDHFYVVGRMKTV